MENFGFLLFMVAVAVFGRFLLSKSRARARAWEEGLKDLCAREGWRLGVVDPARGPRSGTAIRPDREPEDWMLSFHRIGSGVTGGTSSMNSGDRWTRWRDPTYALDSGLAVLGPAIPAKTLEKTHGMLEKEGMLSRVMLDAFIKGLDPKHALRLRVVEGTFEPARATLLATQGQERAFDALIDSDVFDALTAFEGRIGDRPSLIRDEQGLMLRLERTVKDHDEIVRLIQACRAVSKALRADTKTNEVA